MYRLLFTKDEHAHSNTNTLAFIKLLPDQYHHLVVEACMFDNTSCSIHLAQYSYSQWLDFTVQNRASVLTAAATLTSTIAIQELKVYGSWLAETISDHVDGAVNRLFRALPYLTRLHLYEFPAHSPPTLAQSISHLTALTELIIESPSCPLTHRHVNAVLGACTSLDQLRKVPVTTLLFRTLG